MCIGRTPQEVLEIVLDALPTALDCDLVYLAAPGAPPIERASLRGTALVDEDLAALRVKVAAPPFGAPDEVRSRGFEARASRPEIGGGAAVVDLPGVGALHCLEAEVPLPGGAGRLFVGRTDPLDTETDRILVRTAANLVATTLVNANVLEDARRKDEFLAQLGHELRNPLAPIMTAIEVLSRQPTAIKEHRIIERHTRHLARLVDDLLDISRVTRGHVELRTEPVDLASALERAVEIAAPLVARYGHRLHVDNAAAYTILGDPVRLAQVFGNLLTNAAKFTPPGGLIEVLVGSEDGQVRVEVRDNGRGIAHDQLARIFEPFVQADRERDALEGGLGLGLAIVANLVHRHGGRVRAHSAGRGRGSSFVVTLPVIEARPAPIEMPAPQAGAARGRVKVLVVDDDVDVAELLSDALQQEGFQTAVAFDGQAALAAWSRFGPHAAVLDVGLPDLDGYDLARTLRAEHGTDFTLIAATGYGQRKDRVRARDAGFDCHFVKPVSVHDLVLALDERVVVRESPVPPS